MDLETYMVLRRDTSGCKPCFALIEYAAGIDLPDEVACHPVIRILEESANACISWSNVRQSRLVVCGHANLDAHALWACRTSFLITSSKPVETLTT